MTEFDLIKKYFVPLAEQFPGSLNLSDDAAIIDIPAGQQLVVTKDAISEGIHFIGNEDPALIARKLLRTNLSDLASMGAAPLCYFLSVTLPKPISEEYIKRFAEGLAHDQKEFGITLAGGDTIATLGTPTFSITAHGLVAHGTALRRNGAKSGDGIFVSGTLGDAALGLRRIQDSGFGIQGEGYLAQRYQLPQPRITLGQSLRGLATSCIDISDGLLQDAGHISNTSQAGIDIDIENLPLSSEAKSAIEQDVSLLPLVYSGGDDYELLFTLPKGANAPEGTTRIGRVVVGNNVRLLKDGKEIPVTKTGYGHF
jgi:thiamine-monophosphate kinase